MSDWEIDRISGINAQYCEKFKNREMERFEKDIEMKRSLCLFSNINKGKRLQYLEWIGQLQVLLQDNDWHIGEKILGRQKGKVLHV